MVTERGLPDRLADRLCLIAVLLTFLAVSPPAAGQGVQALPPGPPVPTGVGGDDPLPPAPLTATVLGREELRAGAALTLAGPLSEIPGLSLLGGARSLVADPPSQWVTLRGAGPGGTSRALVLLDGIPVNDPFGGWLAWPRLLSLGIGRVEAVRGPSPLVWGTATGGLIRLDSAPPEADGVTAEASYGDHGTTALSLVATGHRERWAGSIGADVADTDGFPLVRRDQRGPLDVPADGQARTVTQTLTYRLSRDVTASLAGWYLAAEQGLGTPGQASTTEAGGASLGVRVGSLPAGQWDSTLFAERHAFTTTVTSQSPDRATERPALRQEIPADSAGGAVQWTRRFLRQSGIPGPHLFSAGADARWTRGESRETIGESFGPLPSRRAGGQELQAGVFAQDIDSIYSWLEVMMGVRGVYWRSFDRAGDSGAPDPLGRRALADRESLSVDQRTAVRVQVTDEAALRASEALGFRPPTLYEQFSTSRVRDDVTLGNPGLDAERLITFDAGADYRGSRGLTFRGTAFWNELIDAIGAVTLPAEDTRTGCPAGTTCRQRQNLERSRIVGSEVEVEYVVTRWWRLRASYLFQASRVVKAGGGRGLEGRELALVPRHQLTGSLRHSRPGWLALSAEVRYVGPRFEDDLNHVRVRGAVVVSLAAAMRVWRGTELFLSVENLLGSQPELSRTADGVATIGAGTAVRGGLRVAF